jgi:hypothetical protein
MRLDDVVSNLHVARKGIRSSHHIIRIQQGDILIDQNRPVAKPIASVIVISRRQTRHAVHAFT